MLLTRYYSSVESCSKRCYSVLSGLQVGAASTAESKTTFPIPQAHTTEAAYSKRDLIKAKISRIEKTAAKAPFEDTFNRKHTYLRISLTERCNLRCIYCMPEEGVKLTPNPKLLTNDEIERLVRIFASHGVDKVRLTGGEPSIRKDLVQLIERIGAVDGIKDIGITSNGVTLAKHLKDLRNAGLNRINISLDTLDHGKFILMTRRNGLDKVLNTISVAESLFEYVKINTVVMKNINDGEINDFVAMTEKRNLDVRFIEYMPFGGNHFSTKKFVSYSEMLDRIKEQFNGNIRRMIDAPNDTTKGYRVGDFVGKFGFITSMSEHFCGTCNRLRITADGNLKVCLHGNKEVSMRDLMRGNKTDAEIADVIAEAVLRKKKQHAVFRNGKSSTYAQSSNDSYRRINLKGVDLTVSNVSALPYSLISIYSSLPPNLVSQSYRQYSTKVGSSGVLSHVSSDGSVHQVDVAAKIPTTRIAVAEGLIRVTPEIVSQIEENVNKKGDVLACARIAGIMAAKRTAELIPLCHNIPISQVQVELAIDKNSSAILIRTTAKTVANTGIEMEALTACSVAALTIYDMCKAVSSDMVIEHVRLISKRGGKSDFQATNSLFDTRP